MAKNEFKKGEIVIYKSKEGPKLDVRLEEDTVWLTQKQMAELFNKGVPTINEHIKNIYKESELKEDSTIRNFRMVQKEGGRIVERDIDFYNLDVIISVGYRVKSLRDRSVIRYMDELEREGKVEQVGNTGRGVIYRLK